MLVCIGDWEWWVFMDWFWGLGDAIGDLDVTILLVGALGYEDGVMY